MDGPAGAVRVLLGAVEADHGDEKASLGDLLGAFNDKLATAIHCGWKVYRESETQTCNGPKSPSRIRCRYSPNPVPRCRASLLNTTLPRGQAVHLGANMQRSNMQDYQ